MQRRTVLFDFDGTLALGRGPLEAYAACLNELVSEASGGEAGSELLAHCQDAIPRFDAGETVFRDAYDAIRVTALSHGVTEAQLSAAYLRSRALLATEAAPIYGPEGLPEFLTDLAEHADCVLATNAPEIGVHRALDSLGIADSISLVYCDVGKPAGLERIIPGSLPKGRPFPSATSGSTTSRPPNAMARTLPSWAWANPTASLRTEAPPSPISTTTSCAGPQQAHLLPRYRAVPAMIPTGTTDMRKSLAIPAAVAATTLTLAACVSSGTDTAEGDW